MNRLEQRYPHLLDPRSLVGPAVVGRVIARSGHMVAQMLNARAAEVAALNIPEVPATVIIQGRQILDARGRIRKLSGEQQAAQVLATAENIRSQTYTEHVAIAATVDAQAFNPTPSQRHALAGLGVNPLWESSAVNASASINYAARHMDARTGTIVSMAAGNRFATGQALRAAAQHYTEGAVGAYGPLVLDRHASTLGYVLLGGDSEYYQQEAECDKYPTADTNGYMSDAGAVMNADLLRITPIDPAYGRGGGVRAWAAGLQKRSGDVWYDPALAVHDSRAFYLDHRILLEEASQELPTDYLPPTK